MQRAERRGDREGALADLVDGMTSRAIEANKSEPRRSEGDSGTLGSLAAGGGREGWAVTGTMTLRLQLSDRAIHMPILSAERRKARLHPPACS